MDKQYRMAEWFNSALEEDDLLYFCEDERKVVVHAVNAHDVMQDRIAELEQERDQLKAQNAEFRQAAHIAGSWLSWWLDTGECECEGGHICGKPQREHELRDIYMLLNKSPVASLADIKDKAIEDFQTYFDAEYYGEELSQFIEQYADKLRQQATS